MRNVMKAQFFQIMRDKVVKGMFVVSLLMQVMMVVLPIWLDNEKPVTAGEFFATNDGASISFPIFYLVIVTAQICGIDFLDKTNNYELMGGHRRLHVFLGRVIPAMLVGGVGALFLVIFPFGVYAALYGWGSKVALGWTVLRLLLLLLPFLRMVCEFSFITFMVKNPYIVMGLGYMMFVLAMGLGEMIESANVFLGILNTSLVMMVSKWMTYGLGDDLNYIFDASLGADIVWGTILASVVFGAAALYLGYVFFKNDDMN